MPVELIDGSIFLHVPKTGGSWVHHVLRQEGLVRREFGHIHGDLESGRLLEDGMHSLTRLTAELFKAQFSIPKRVRQVVRRRMRALPVPRAVGEPSRFRFCFVRHPARWYESWWGYFMDREGPDWTSALDLDVRHTCFALRETGSSEFSSFVENVNAKHPGFVSELFGRYTRPGIGFVGRQERLVDDLVEVLRRRSLPFDEDRVRSASRVNRSKQVGVRWDEKLWERTMRLEYAGLVKFGYNDSTPLLETEKDR